MRDDAVLGRALPLDRGLGPRRLRDSETARSHVTSFESYQHVTDGQTDCHAACS